jgi:tyrosinase
MTVVLRNIWNLGTAQKPWHENTLGYAKAVRAMQQLPISDPRSWRFQAAIHGISGMALPSAAPWNACQHQSWFPALAPDVPQPLEQIARSFVPSAQGQANWALHPLRRDARRCRHR